MSPEASFAVTCTRPSSIRLVCAPQARARRGRSDGWLGRAGGVCNRLGAREGFVAKASTGAVEGRDSSRGVREMRRDASRVQGVREVEQRTRAGTCTMVVAAISHGRKTDGGKLSHCVALRACASQPDDTGRERTQERKMGGLSARRVRVNGRRWRWWGPREGGSQSKGGGKGERRHFAGGREGRTVTRTSYTTAKEGGRGRGRGKDVRRVAVSVRRLNSKRWARLSWHRNSSAVPAATRSSRGVRRGSRAGVERPAAASSYGQMKFLSVGTRSTSSTTGTCRVSTALSSAAA